MTGNIGFKDFLDHMRGEQALELAFETPAKSSVPEFIEEKNRFRLRRKNDD
jgi:putative NADH-flavin reductase